MGLLVVGVESKGRRIVGDGFRRITHRLVGEGAGGVWFSPRWIEPDGLGRIGKGLAVWPFRE